MKSDVILGVSASLRVGLERVQTDESVFPRLVQNGPFSADKAWRSGRNSELRIITGDYNGHNRHPENHLDHFAGRDKAGSRNELYVDGVIGR